MNPPKTKGVFVTQLKVRFGDVDPAGIVYFPQIYDFIHRAFEDLWDVHVGKRYYHLVGQENMGFPLVHSEVDFKHPMHFGDHPIVKITCFKLGHSSIGLRYRFVVADVLCVDARMTTACVVLDELKSTRIPEEYRTRLAEIMETQ